MNILLIGNGFDLAHKLPTRYVDFLDFLYRLISYVNYKPIMSSGGLNNINNPINEYLDHIIFEKYRLKDELLRLIHSNIWIEYFKDNEDYSKENWVDFESEISKVIRSFDNDLHNKTEYDIDDIVTQLSNPFFAKYYKRYIAEGIDKNQSITFRNIRDRLIEDLNKLIRALEIYLSDYINNIPCFLRSPDIEMINVDKVLSFNYTNTYSRLYDPSLQSEYDYIHGHANITNDIKVNNMVLGIDEYLTDDRKNKETEFICFKKFFQRIYKQNGCKYKDWLESFNSCDNNASNSNSETEHRLYIFGHSLDVTDKDILSELLLNNNIHTTVFYVNKEVMEKQITNLVRIIGQDELIKRTGGSHKTIEFKQQKEMEITREYNVSTR